MTGLLLGAAAAAAAAIWNSPQAGRKTREQITEMVEQGLFTLLGAGESTIARVLTPEAPTPAVVDSVVVEAPALAMEPPAPGTPASLVN